MVPPRLADVHERRYDAAQMSCARRIGSGTAAALLCGLAACGGETPAPTAPAPAPPPVPVTITVTPNPLRATQVTASSGGVTYRFTADVTLSAAAGARIAQMTTTVASAHALPEGDISLRLSASSTVSIQIQPGSPTVYAHPQEIGGTFSGEKVTWRIEASGMDSQGRPFTASSAEIPIEFVTTTPTGS
jgi:hypothetical protein